MAAYVQNRRIWVGRVAAIVVLALLFLKCGEANISMT